MTTTTKPLTTRRTMWLGLALALSAALAYVLIGMGVLAVGDVAREQDGTNIAFIAAGCYFVGGWLILLRRRGLLIFGLVMNTLVLLFFFQMYQGRPTVVFSPGGLISKAAQILLEISLIYLIIRDWRK